AGAWQPADDEPRIPLAGDPQLWHAGAERHGRLSRAVGAAVPVRRWRRSRALVEVEGVDQVHRTGFARFTAQRQAARDVVEDVQRAGRTRQAGFIGQVELVGKSLADRHGRVAQPQLIDTEVI